MPKHFSGCVILTIQIPTVWCISIFENMPSQNPISKDLNTNEKGSWTDGFKIYENFPFFWFVLAEPPSWLASPSPGVRL